MIRRLLMIVVFFSIFWQSKCQDDTARPHFFTNCIIKTKPFQLIFRNPVLGFEKPVSRQLSIEAELLYRNRAWETSGREWDFGRFYNSDGARFLTATKFYFGKTSRRLDQETQKAPIGFFISLEYAVSYTRFNNFDKYSYKGSYYETVRLTNFWLELNPSLGGQFFLSDRLTLEFYGGLLFRTYERDKELILKSHIPSKIGSTHVEVYGTGERFLPNFRMSVGYRLK